MGHLRSDSTVLVSEGCALNTSRRIKAVTLATLLVLISGCSSAMMATQPGYMADPEYQARGELAASLFPADQVALSSEAMEKILNSKVQIRRGGRLAVVKLAEAGDWTMKSTHWGMPMMMRDATDRRDVAGSPLARLVEALEGTKRFKDVAVLPSMVIPSRPSIAALREMAARFQADSVLIYRQYTVTHEIHKFLATNEGKADVMVEAVLLDTRTGAIPFTAVATQDFQVKKNADDLDTEETATRAKNQATATALVNIAGQLDGFLKALP